MYRAAEHTSLFIRVSPRGENKSYQHVVMAAQAFNSDIQRMLTRPLISDRELAAGLILEKKTTHATVN